VSGPGDRFALQRADAQLKALSSGGRADRARAQTPEAGAYTRSDFSST